MLTVINRLENSQTASFNLLPPNKLYVCEYVQHHLAFIQFV